MEQDERFEARVKAARRMARRGGVPADMHYNELGAAHGQEIVDLLGPRGTLRDKHDLIEAALGQSTDHEFDRAFMGVMRPDGSRPQMRDIREAFAQAEGVSTKTVERWEEQGAQAFVRRLDDLIALEQEARASGTAAQVHEMEREYILMALVRELVRDNPGALERVEAKWSKRLSAATSLSGRGIYGPRELFLEVLDEDDLEKPFSTKEDDGHFY